MPVSERRTDRLASMAVCAGFAVFTLWAGTRLVNHALETTFFKDFFLEWEVALQRHKSEDGRWPQFSGGNHVEYMDRLSTWMRKEGSPPPMSNTERAYVYRLKRFGWPEERLFLLCSCDRIILYAISEKTFAKMDRWIDGEVNDKQGVFTGKLSKDGTTYVGELQL